MSGFIGACVNFPRDRKNPQDITDILVAMGTLNDFVVIVAVICNRYIQMSFVNLIVPTSPNMINMLNTVLTLIVL